MLQLPTVAAHASITIGEYYDLKGDFPKANDFIQAGITIFDTLQYKEGLKRGYISLGLAKMFNQNEKASLVDFDKALALCEETGDL
ncbi:MAG: hypothetical protein R2795_10265 [Saprospiraceae bacterium]